MRIAIVAPLAEPLPPPGYGGSERVVSVLTEELVRRGHDVTLFASGDSNTNADLVPCCPRATRLDPTVRDWVAYHVAQLSLVYDHQRSFDIIHNHTTFVAFPFARSYDAPTLTTIHGRIDLPEYRMVFRRFRDQALVAISRAQREVIPDLNWRATIHNGVDLTAFSFQPKPCLEPYLVFLGRLSPEKRPDRAVEIARELDMPLMIAAKIDPSDRGYYEHAIAPLLREYTRAEYIGEVQDRQKNELLGGAYACLFPVDWPEPFGLTMVESMATGTPVVAMRKGAVAEVLEDGVTGFVCDSVTEMVQAVARVAGLERRACRDRVEQLFSTEVMTDAYERAYLDAVGRDGDSR